MRCISMPKAGRPLAHLSVAVVILLSAALAAVPAVAQEAVYPGEEWEYVWRDARALQAYGWSRPELSRAWRFIRDSSKTTGLMVIDRGRVILEFGDVEGLSYVASVRKSILAMLYGRYVEDGTIDLEKTLAQLGMDDVGGLLDIEKQATIHHLITARSGVYHPASNSGDNLADAPERGSQRPGEYMLYSNWDFNAAGAVFEQETGVNIYDALEEQLAIPLQFQDWDRSAQRKSGNLEISRNPAYHMWLSTRDMARIGYLMLREGRWGDEHVISRDWARRISSVVTPLDGMNPVWRRDGSLGYGYMWWIWDGPNAVGPFEGAYQASGAWGQWIIVMPVLDLVIAHKTNAVYRRSTSGATRQRLIDLLLDAKLDADGKPYPWRAEVAAGVLNGADSLVTHTDRYSLASALAHRAIAIDSTEGTLLRALGVFKRITQLDPQSIYALYAVGRTALLANTDLDLAVRSFKQYLEHEQQPEIPSHAAARWRLGMVYELQGRIEEARAEYEAALRLDPSFARAGEALGKLLPKR
ncbi:MAG: serine hydrolase [Gemmatimonadales bacterium]|nr:serine hydrolase [Gemmatimonadales bacterium]NIN10695.1 serine hydrolase [Gemmatimonadales bacterium]NIN49023.1 serine hydrolase [Gemmatimonadales bacterium]NIP06487.1 serine hydrolase [Gemmatimonadales bacterium]NIQ98832.1 serine hydrolase [Gemmatimonadales bacterium]